MAHNFRELNSPRTYFISKSGHDSNDGLTPNTPKKTVINDCVVGAGTYDMSSYRTLSYVLGDGKVIFDYKGEKAYNYMYGYENIEIVNANNPPDYYAGQGTNGLTNCIVRNSNISIAMNSNRHRYYTNVIAVNSNLQVGAGVTRIYSSIISNSQCGGLGSGNYFKDSYLGKDSIYMAGDISYIFNSNVQGVMRFSGTNFDDGLFHEYAVQDLLLGSPQDNGYDVGVNWYTTANLIADGYNGTKITQVEGYIPTLINRDPLFNDAANGDFSLQAGSPHISRAFDGISNIGGTSVAMSVKNTENGVGSLEIIPSPEIDITNPNSYTLKNGEVEGYIDYIQKLGSSSLTLGVISPVSSFNFDSDFPGGDIENRNVPDSEPLTYDYPREFITSSDANDLRTLVIAGHNAQINEWVRVNGEDREIISTTSSTITVGTNFRALIITGTMVMVGSKSKIGALRPNRLTYLLRTSKQDARPTLLSHWDNDIDPLYNKTGQYLAQEWDTTPGYFIDPTLNSVYGSGDSDAPQGLLLNEISCKWINVRVYMRNNYKS